MGSKNKLRRFRENETFSNVVQPTREEMLSDFQHKGKWEKFFGNSNPIVLELGCGKGEYKLLAELIEDYNLDGIISDNRLGLYHDDVPTVIITHQLQVLSGSTTWLSTQLHQHFIKKFDFCWVPDYAGDFSLSGRLSSHDDPHLNTTFIGPLSRLHRCNTPSKYDLLVLLSGPEPQRAILEKKLLDELIFFQGKVLFMWRVNQG